MPIKLNLIAAACQNGGIGKENNLPWRLKSEMQHFTKMTRATKDSGKKNVVIMGRRTWDSIPPKYKPLSERINFVLSTSQLDLNKYKDVHSFKTWNEIYNKLNDDDFKKEYETVWVIGGSNIYKSAMDSKYFYRLYLTNIMKEFECDTFLPPIPKELKVVRDVRVPVEAQEENGIKYQYEIYENPKC